MRRKGLPRTGPRPKPPVGAMSRVGAPLAREASRQSLAAALLVALVAFGMYAPTLGAGWTGTDDTELIVENARVLGSAGALTDSFRHPFFPASGARADYYRPLATVTFSFDLGEDGVPSPFRYHLTNVLLCAARHLMSA